MSTESRVPEAVVARLRPHGRALFWPSAALVAILAATGYYYGSFDEPWQNLAVLGGALLSGLLLWLIPLLHWLGRHYTITTRRIVLRSGFFVRVRQELLHSRGYDVSVRRTWLQALFRSGTIRVSSGTEHRLDLRDVPDAALVQQALQELTEQATALQARAAQGARLDPSALGDEGSFWTGR